MSESNLSTTESQQTDDSPAPIVSGSPSESEVKEFEAVDNSHPLVQETGETALERNTTNGLGEFLSESIYEHDSIFAREYLQNAETACIRAAKLLLRNHPDYGNEWLTRTVHFDAETGETISTPDDEVGLPQAIRYVLDGQQITSMERPRRLEDIIAAARNIGYDPTIEIDVYRDQRRIEWSDNGIGMTAYEVENAFNENFSSGSATVSDTGGKWGVGSLTFGIPAGTQGSMEVITRTRRQEVPEYDMEGIRFYSYLGGCNPLPNHNIPDNFYGTKFIIPAKEEFALDKLQSWVEKYSKKLRVPILYKEHDAGSTPVEEEYEDGSFVNSFDEQTPVVIERPGEFTAVAGPDVINRGYSSKDDDTWLVSMPIDRNTDSRTKSLWKIAIQIHDEQGRIIAGPHRGQYRSEVDSLHEDDIVLPEPTGDRDRLQKDSQQKQFFNYVGQQVKQRELEQVADIVEKMKRADHPATVISENAEDWALFKKMVNYHATSYAMGSLSAFTNFLKSNHGFPRITTTLAKQIYYLFREVSLAPWAALDPAKKKYRSDTYLGNILSNNDPHKVYMTVSTGGKFKERLDVVKNTHSTDDAGIIKVENAGRYDTYGSLFGFKKLKDVPLVNSEACDEPHDYNVPQSIHDSNISKGSSKASRTKPDTIDQRQLKLRTDTSNNSIDCYMPIEGAKKRLDNGSKLNGESKLILFRRSSDHNISDHYEMAKYAAIASVTGPEYDELKEYDQVMTYEDYVNWSTSTLFATEDGAMTVEEMLNDDRMVIIAFAAAGSVKEVKQLMGDEYADLRQLYANDVRDQFNWKRILGYDPHDRSVDDPDDDEKMDTLVAVADRYVLDRSLYAFDQLGSFHNRQLCGLRLTSVQYSRRRPVEWKTLDGDTKDYRLMADTPKWDNDSDVYDLFHRSDVVDKMLLGFHDSGVDPTEVDLDKLQNASGVGASVFNI